MFDDQVQYHAILCWCKGHETSPGVAMALMNQWLELPLMILTPCKTERISQQMQRLASLWQQWHYASETSSEDKVGCLSILQQEESEEPGKWDSPTNNRRPKLKLFRLRWSLLLYRLYPTRLIILMLFAKWTIIFSPLFYFGKIHNYPIKLRSVFKKDTWTLRGSYYPLKQFWSVIKIPLFSHPQLQKRKCAHAPIIIWHV